MKNAALQIHLHPRMQYYPISSAYLEEVPNRFPLLKAVLYFNNTQDGSTWNVDSSPRRFRLTRTR